VNHEVVPFGSLLIPYVLLSLSIVKEEYDYVVRGLVRVQGHSPPKPPSSAANMITTMNNQISEEP